MTDQPIIVWFRQDLRIEDQPALLAAINTGSPIIPLYVWAPQEEGEWAPGAASRWWLHHALIHLKAELDSLKLPLVIKKGSSLQVLLSMIEQTGAGSVYWNRGYEPLTLQRDAKIKAELTKGRIEAKLFNSALFNEPWTVLNKKNKPFQVFTPFWKECLNLGNIALPLPKPKVAKGLKEKIHSEEIESLSLLPQIPWDKGIKKYWALENLNIKKHTENVLQHIVNPYLQRRDFPGLEGTSQLSPYLHFGQISVRMIWHYVREKLGDSAEVQGFLRQLGWREFGYYLLYHFPHTPLEPLQEKFRQFAWEKKDDQLKAWQRGMTGYPIVDAGMRQLWQIGWMHNRVRMIVGSFLVKDLRIAWQEGAKWFWDTLVDADLANNTLGWQWIAGCGADAAPYFRIFNPMTQGEKFDATGDYVRQWIPEIRALPNKWIHRPWEAPLDVLQQAKIILGKTYPFPIVDHAQARLEALKAFGAIKNDQNEDD